MLKSTALPKSFWTCFKDFAKSEIIIIGWTRRCLAGPILSFFGFQGAMSSLWIFIFRNKKYLVVENDQSLVDKKDGEPQNLTEQFNCNLSVHFCCHFYQLPPIKSEFVEHSCLKDWCGLKLWHDHWSSYGFQNWLYSDQRRTDRERLPFLNSLTRFIFNAEILVR